MRPTDPQAGIYELLFQYLVEADPELAKIDKKTQKVAEMLLPFILLIRQIGQVLPLLKWFVFMLVTVYLFVFAWKAIDFVLQLPNGPILGALILGFVAGLTVARYPIWAIRPVFLARIAVECFFNNVRAGLK